MNPKLRLFQLWNEIPGPTTLIHVVQSIKAMTSTYDIYIIPDGPNGPPLDLGGSGGGGSGGITVNNATWWKTNPIKRKRWVAFDGNEIKNRGFVLICSDFLVIRCQYGSWWQIVAQVPCDACDQQEAHEKAMEAWCRSEGIDFKDEFGITDVQHSKLAMMAVMGCCEEFTFTEECAVNELFNLIAKEAGEEIFPRLNECERDWILANRGRFGRILESTLRAVFKEREVMNTDDNNQHGCGDAFRHAYWNALMTVYFWDNEIKAKEFADAHECESSPGFEGARAMDFHNNAKGREIGILCNDQLLDLNEIESAVCSLLLNGHLLVLQTSSDPSSNPIASNLVDCQCN